MVPFCLEARERIEVSFSHLFGANDDALYKVSQQVLRGEHAWLEEGIVGMPPFEPGGAKAVVAPAAVPKPARREVAGVGD